jgi:hypothetical protein
MERGRDASQLRLFKVILGRRKGFVKDHVQGVPYQVLTVSYSEPGRFSRGWAIEVRAVPRALKHVVQGRLVAEALPKTRDWLISNDHSPEREGSHQLTFYFDELTNEITTEENSSIKWSTQRM